MPACYLLKKKQKKSKTTNSLSFIFLSSFVSSQWNMADDDKMKNMNVNVAATARCSQQDRHYLGQSLGKPRFLVTRPFAFLFYIYIIYYIIFLYFEVRVIRIRFMKIFFKFGHTIFSTRKDLIELMMIWMACACLWCVNLYIVIFKRTSPYCACAV